MFKGRNPDRVRHLGSGLLHLGFLLFALDFIIFQNHPSHMLAYWVSFACITLGTFFSHYSVELGGPMAPDEEADENLEEGLSPGEASIEPLTAQD